MQWCAGRICGLCLSLVDLPALWVDMSFEPLVYTGALKLAVTATLEGYCMTYVCVCLCVSESE